MKPSTKTNKETFYKSTFKNFKNLSVDGGSHFLTRAVLPKAKAIVAAAEDDILGSCYKP